MALYLLSMRVCSLWIRFRAIFSTALASCRSAISAKHVMNNRTCQRTAGRLRLRLSSCIVQCVAMTYRWRTWWCRWSPCCSRGRCPGSIPRGQERWTGPDDRMIYAWLPKWFPRWWTRRHKQTLRWERVKKRKAYVNNMKPGLVAILIQNRRQADLARLINSCLGKEPSPSSLTAFQKLETKIRFIHLNYTQEPGTSAFTDGSAATFSIPTGKYPTNYKAEAEALDKVAREHTKTTEEGCHLHRCPVGASCPELPR